MAASTTGETVDGRRIDEWRALAASIRAALEGGTGAPAFVLSGNGDADGRTGRRVLVVDDDEGILDTVGRLLEAEGHLVRGARSGAEARSALSPCPHGAIVDVRLPDGTGYELVEHIRSLPGGGEVAILMVSGLTGFVDRVEAMHCGADGYVEKPLDLQALIRRMEHLLARHDPRPRRVLVLEDDPVQAAFASLVLRSAGYQVEVCEDPARFEARLLAFAPELVVADVLLPGVRGPDLVRLLRQDERHVALPVVFLTTEHAPADRIEVARAGGDAHLGKPVDPNLLIATVAAHIERARLLKGLLNRDGLTRLLTHSAFMERARAAYAQASREPGRPVSWVMIDLDHFKSVNDRHGHPVGDRVLASLAGLLRRRLRQTDALGRYGGEEFGVLLHDLGGEDAVRLVQRLLDEFSATEHADDGGAVFRVTFSAGVARLDPETTDFPTWRRLADEALYAAKVDGRARVRAHGSGAGDTGGRLQ